MIKQLLKRVVSHCGYDIKKQHEVGSDPFRDMAYFLRENTRPLILDVGANAGQTATEFRTRFPEATIHSFEPSPTTFHKLTHQTKGRDIHTWQAAVGAATGQVVLHEHADSELSSVLAMDTGVYGDMSKSTPVEMIALDGFCREQSIDRIDVLKSDTQGNDLEVLRGAKRMLQEGRIGLIFVELLFARIYREQADFVDVCSYLKQSDFQVVALYRLYVKDRMAEWIDGLFAHKSLIHHNAGDVRRR